MDTKKFIEEIKSLSVLELNELVHAIEEEFGVSATAPVQQPPLPLWKKRRNSTLC